MPTLLYGAHVPTTVVPILGTVFAPGAGISDHNLLLLTAIYIPFVLVPLLLVYRVLATPTVFPAAPAPPKSPTKRH